MIIDPKKISLQEMHGYLLGAVTPRPIALASTVDLGGRVNLSPFSFFNCFGTNPPLLIFAPSRRVRDHTTKHTHENVLEVPEVVIHIVSYAMVQQMSLSSTEYPKGVNEFVKAGFTQVPSLIVRPPRVKESPVAFECKVTRIIPTGDQGGSGILLMSEIQCVHVHDDLLDEKGKIDPVKLDVVGRLGGEGYCRVQGAAIFSVPKPAGIPGIGFDQIPDRIRYSSVLTGNDLGLLASVSVLPQGASLPAAPDPEWHAARMQGEEAVHRLAQAYLAKGDVHGAWRTLLA